MIERVLHTAFDTATDVLLFVQGFSSPFKGRIQNIDDEYVSLLQCGSTPVLFVFSLKNVISCGLFLRQHPSDFNLLDDLDDREKLHCP